MVGFRSEAIGAGTTRCGGWLGSGFWTFPFGSAIDHLRASAAAKSCKAAMQRFKLPSYHFSWVLALRKLGRMFTRAEGLLRTGQAVEPRT